MDAGTPAKQLQNDRLSVYPFVFAGRTLPVEPIMKIKKSQEEAVSLFDKIAGQLAMMLPTKTQPFFISWSIAPDDSVR